MKLPPVLVEIIPLLLVLGTFVLISSYWYIDECCRYQGGERVKADFETVLLWALLLASGTVLGAAIGGLVTLIIGVIYPKAVADMNFYTGWLIGGGIGLLIFGITGWIFSPKREKTLRDELMMEAERALEK